MAAGADSFAPAALRLPDDDCCANDPPNALRAAKRKTGIDIPKRQNPNPTNLRKRARPKTSLLHLSTVAAQRDSKQPWVKFQSAGWVNIQSARTRKSSKSVVLAESCSNVPNVFAGKPVAHERYVGSSANRERGIAAYCMQ